MSIKKPYKRMIREKTISKFIGICDCGLKHEFNRNEVVVKVNKQNNNSVYIEFAKIYKCPNCNSEYSGFFDSYGEYKIKKYSFIGILLSIAIVCLILFGVVKFIEVFFIESNEPKSFNEITNKEYNEFREWEQKQNNTEFENTKLGEQ